MSLAETLLLVGWSMGCQLPFLGAWMHRCIPPAPGDAEQVGAIGGSMLALEFAGDPEQVGSIPGDERSGVRGGLISAVKIDFFFIIAYGSFLTLFALAAGLASGGASKFFWCAGAGATAMAGISDWLENKALLGILRPGPPDRAALLKMARRVWAKWLLMALALALIGGALVASAGATSWLHRGGAILVVPLLVTVVAVGFRRIAWVPRVAVALVFLGYSCAWVLATAWLFLGVVPGSPGG